MSSICPTHNHYEIGCVACETLAVEGRITLNLGCGDRTYSEYPPGFKCINMDIREDLEVVDEVGDVTDIPFPRDHFDYILASDILEHFPVARTADILEEWARVLKPRGTIEFRVPNLAYWCAYYLQTKDAKHTSWGLYGGQDYVGNYHYVAFDGQWLADLCKVQGLVPSQYEEDGPNFIFKAVKR